MLLLCTGHLALLYTVNQCAKELLYADQDLDVLYKAKAFIDTTVFRGGALLGSAGTWLLVSMCGYTVGDVGAALLCVGIGWLALVLVFTRQAGSGGGRRGYDAMNGVRVG